MARLWLDPHEWAEMREVILRVPEAQRDDKWTRAYEAVDAVCEAVLDVRDLIKDPRPLEDKSDH